MKTIKLYVLLLTTALIGFACNPIEDESLRKKHFGNAGAPISVEELNAALSVTQPIPNADDRVAGDQYVVIKNSRPEIGGVWRYETSTGEKSICTDHDTLIYNSIGIFNIYYIAISANQAVRSKTFTVEVTNCFDEYDFLLSGAVDKADRTAKKVWRLADENVPVYNGMYGNWKYYPDFKPVQNQWGTVIITQEMREQTVVFEFNDHKLVIYAGDGSVIAEGGWAFNHESPDPDPRGVLYDAPGQLITSIPLPGQSVSFFQKRPSVFSGVSTPYWICRVSENELVLAFPSIYNRDPATTEDWDIDATYFFFIPKEE